MSTWAERKSQRRVHYELHIKGRKLVTCGACNGSGHYDHDGSPACASCGGTGRIRETLHDVLVMRDPEARRNGIIPRKL